MEKMQNVSGGEGAYVTVGLRQKISRDTSIAPSQIWVS